MNIKRYVLPASIAAALHSALIFAFPGELVPTMPLAAIQLLPTPKPPPDDPPPPVVPDDETPTDTTTPPVPLGVEPPVLPDLPPVADDRIFQIDVPRDPINPVPSDRLGPPGDPNGIQTEMPPIKAAVFTQVVDLDRTPRTTSQIPPDYPSSMRQAGIDGQVLVEFTVDSTGRVMTARVLKSTQSDFEAATIRAVLRWRFEPGKRDGRAVPFRMVVPVRFSLGQN
jgi:protein TonB